MAIKRTGQLGFADAVLAGRGTLDRLVDLVLWYRFEKLLAGLRKDGPGRGQGRSPDRPRLQSQTPRRPHGSFWQTGQ